MSDFLSQEQIDSLLQQQSTGGFEIQDINDSTSDEATRLEPDYNALRAACELFNEQSSRVFTTVLNKTAQCSVSLCQNFDPAVIKEAINDSALSIALSFSGKISGTLYSVMTKKDVAFISDLMMMGDGTTAYSEEHNDAISELYNQVMGAFTTILGDKCGGSVTSADNAKVSDLDTSFKEFAAESTDLVITTIKITDTDEFSMGFIIPRDIGLQLMNIFKENSNISADTIDNRSGSLVSDNDKMTDSSSSFSDTGNDSFQPSNRSSGMSVQAPRENIDMLLDIELDVSIELGRADLSIKKILELAPGSIVELERMAGEPVDLMVNNRVVAKGEVVIVDENFGIRIVSLVSPEERIKSLR